MKEETKKQNKETKNFKPNENIEKNNNDLIAIVRISGMVKVRKEIENTLERLRLKRKYSCILINLNKNLEGMLKKVRFYVAYGSIDKKTLVKLLKERARNIEGNKKELNIKPEDIADKILKGEKLEKLGIKPFFRLHPPKKGIKSKLQYPKGVLGNNKQDINKLIERML